MQQMSFTIQLSDRNDEISQAVIVEIKDALKSAMDKIAAARGLTDDVEVQMLIAGATIRDKDQADAMETLFSYLGRTGDLTERAEDYSQRPAIDPTKPVGPGRDQWGATENCACATCRRRRSYMDSVQNAMMN
jgi:hypothetical protein